MVVTIIVIAHAYILLTEKTLTQQPDNERNNNTNHSHNNNYIDNSTCIHISDRNKINTKTRQQTQ